MECGEAKMQRVERMTFGFNDLYLANGECVNIKDVCFWFMAKHKFKESFFEEFPQAIKIKKLCGELLNQKFNLKGDDRW